MSVNPKTIWDCMLIEGNPLEIAKDAPYKTTGRLNYYDHWKESTRNTKKRLHAVNHCLEMARHCFNEQMFPSGCDWIVSAISNAESENEVMPELFSMWNEMTNKDASGWPELLRMPPPQIGKRLVALTLLRSIEQATFELSRDLCNDFLKCIRKELPDVCSHLEFTESIEIFQQLGQIKQFSKRVCEFLEPLFEAGRVAELNAILLRHHGIAKSLNNKLVSSTLSPYLPSQFSKSNVPLVLKLIEDLVSANDVEFIDLANLALEEIKSSIKKLIECQTFYATEYLLPFFHNLQQLAEVQLSSSDATKPASLEIVPYDRKYPLHAVGQACRLRFDLVNRGPGPAKDIDIKFLFWGDFDPLEVQRIISELGAGTCRIDIDVHIKESATSNDEFEVELQWIIYDSSEK